MQVLSRVRTVGEGRWSLFHLLGTPNKWKTHDLKHSRCLHLLPRRNNSLFGKEAIRDRCRRREHVFFSPQIIICIHFKIISNIQKCCKNEERFFPLNYLRADIMSCGSQAFQCVFTENKDILLLSHNKTTDIRTLSLISYSHLKTLDPMQWSFKLPQQCFFLFF